MGNSCSPGCRLCCLLWRLLCCSFFPLDVLDGIWDLIESVSEGFLTYSYKLTWTKSRKSYWTTPGVGFGVGGGVSKMLKFNVKVFHATGKALSCELSID